jgi:hypothetical protein
MLFDGGRPLASLNDLTAGSTQCDHVAVLISPAARMFSDGYSRNKDTHDDINMFYRPQELIVTIWDSFYGDVIYAQANVQIIYDFIFKCAVELNI